MRRMIFGKGFLFVVCLSIGTFWAFMALGGIAEATCTPGARAGGTAGVPAAYQPYSGGGGGQKPDRGANDVNSTTECFPCSGATACYTLGDYGTYGCASQYRTGRLEPAGCLSSTWYQWASPMQQCQVWVVSCIACDSTHDIDCDGIVDSQDLGYYWTDTDGDGVMDSVDLWPNDSNCPGTSAKWVRKFRSVNKNNSCFWTELRTTDGTCAGGYHLTDCPAGYDPLADPANWTTTLMGNDTARTYDDEKLLETGGDSSLGADQLAGSTADLLGKIVLNTANTKLDLDTTNSKLTSIDGSLTGIGSKVDGVTSAVTGLGSKIDTTNNNLGTIHSDMSTANSHLSSISGTVGTLGTKVDAVGTAVTGVGTKVDAVGTGVTGLGTKVDAVGTAVTGVGTKVDAVGTGVTGLGSKLDTVNSGLGTLSTDIGLVSSHLTTVESKLDTVNTNLGTLGEKIDTGNTTLTEIKGKIPEVGEGELPEGETETFQDDALYSEEAAEGHQGAAGTDLSDFLTGYISSNPIGSLLAGTGVQVSGSVSSISFNIMGHSYSLDASGLYDAIDGNGLGTFFVALCTIAGIIAIVRD